MMTAKSMMMKNDFLPVSGRDMVDRGWEQLDFLYISGDAYVDHPSFGTAIISRVLESRGYKVGIIAMPDWRSKEDFMRLGRPRLGVLISAGNIDSMVNHYTASKKRRSEDAYAPGNKAGMRPDRATIVYSNRIREAFGDIPVIIGGVEASLRRFSHYDYWEDKVRRSVLADSGADLLIYGMGERQIAEIAECLDSGMNIRDISYIKGTCYLSDSGEVFDSVEIPSHEECCQDKRAYAEACRIQYYEQNPYTGKAVVQKHGGRYLVQNPPMQPLSRQELDDVYELPYMKTYHPMYEKDGGVEAIKEVKFSITSSRGCFGSCNFCALAFHQGRIVTSRSHESILREAEEMAAMADFKGYIHDVGGPTANFRSPACKKQNSVGACKNRQCLFPVPCRNMETDHSEYCELLKKLRAVKGVKKVFIRSGIRFDYLINDKNDEFFYELCRHHISGQLKVAPEHISDKVLKCMGKPSNAVYRRFAEKYKRVNERLGKKQYLVPYLMSSHPGSTLKEAVELALYLKEQGLNPQQVQDFYPTPGTISTCMFYTGLNPLTMKEVYVPVTPKEKAMQRALLQYKNPENYNMVCEALEKAGRTDLIGYGENCLIKPKKERGYGKDFKRKGSVRKNKGGAENRSRQSEKGRHKPGSGGNNRRR